MSRFLFLSHLFTLFFPLIKYSYILFSSLDPFLYPHPHLLQILLPLPRFIHLPHPLHSPPIVYKFSFIYSFLLFLFMLLLNRHWEVYTLLFVFEPLHAPMMVCIMLLIFLLQLVYLSMFAI